MKDEEIKSLINRLNKEESQEAIFLRQISSSVEVARVWEKEPELDDEINIIIPSYRFFFIKNECAKYVGAVLEMSQDLHWYILEEERKKGYLTRALREAVIPYLFYDEYHEKEVQRITIQHGIGDINYTNSKSVAERLGFKAVNQNETIFELDKDKFDWQYENLEEKNGSISKNRFEELRKRLILSYRQLIKISDELLMVYDNDEGLRDLAREVSYFHTRIGNIEWKYNKEND